MSYNIPYSFIPGTKARAQEVNANFKYVLDSADELNRTKLNTTFSNISTEAVDFIKNCSSSRNIGEIITSPLPLTDDGVHLLDGTLLPYGVYKEFIDYIADLYTENPDANYFTTEALWQQSVTTYGVCGKFVYDSVNNTVRLPKITGIIEGTTDENALGDLVEAGLPNITGSFDVTTANSGTNATGCFYNSANWSAGQEYWAGVTNQHNSSYTINASRSSSIYGNSSTVQPQTIKVLYYIVVATTSKTEIQSDIDEIATDLNGKADTDLTNVTNKLSDNFLEKLTPDWNNRISMGLPQYPLSTTTNTFTCPSSGYVSIHADRSVSGNTLFIIINSISYGQTPAFSPAFYDGFIMVSKGDEVKFTTDSTGNTWFITRQFFIPMKGAN